MFNRIKNAFLSGIILLLPLGVTALFIHFLINNIGEPASKLFFGFLPESKFAWLEPVLDVVSVLIVFVIITFFGFLSNYFLGRWFIRLTERVIKGVPFINKLYKTVKQIVDTFSKDQKAVFKKTVMVEYPRPGVFAIGFLTSDAKGEIQDKTGDNVVNVFIPTTPNPTSGFLLMVPESQVIDLDMSIGDGMKVIISGGAVVPEKIVETSTN